MSKISWPLRLVVVGVLAATSSFAAAISHRERADEIRLPDHYEFDAGLGAGFRADADGVFPMRLGFDYPAGGAATVAAWQVDVISPRGRVVGRWIGETGLAQGRGAYRFTWSGKSTGGISLASGFYSVRLRAVPAVRLASEQRIGLLERVRLSFEQAAGEMVEQRQDILLGQVATPAMPVFKGLPGNAHPRRGGTVGAQMVPAGSLPYSIYYGNLHSQTNHSDGGTPVASCGGAEVPQGGQYGPADAYAMMRDQAHGDFLLTSEHNHMYDGSTGTNASADPATAKALFQSGLSAAATYRSAHPDFLALYGNEWGVISNGGHLNIFNPDGLATWEVNGSGQLIGDVSTAKSDYAALYATMKQRGWIGQFNHPASSGQFLVGGTALGYDANGRDVMVAAEVLNSSAFSTNLTETETSRSTYTTAWNILLERGYHVAPVTDQDNHCANWGLSFRNRTGVLLPTGTTLNVANFIDALKARRAFATEDKTAQLVLTGNGYVMGQAFANNGTLTLAANYASNGGGSAARVQFFEGVPARNGTVTQLSEGSGSYVFTPTAGEHFYYAVVTEADGDRLWSAPVWVSQGAGGGDSTLPVVAASESGSAGNITLSATASDNVGVSNVEFFVDGVLKGSDATSPYSLALDSTSLANGSHSLVAKASDAAGNLGSSAAVSFSISNPVSTQFNEVESNGSAATANAVSHAFTSIVGTMGASTDKDFFALPLAAGETVRIDMTGPASVDYDLYLVNASDATLTSSAGSTSSESLTYKNGASAQTVYAKVISYSGSSATATYTLKPVYTASAPVTELVGNGGFESGNTVWTASSGVIDNGTGQAARTGSWKAWLNGYGAVHTDTLLQSVAIPAAAASANFSFWIKVVSAETTTTAAYDTLKVQVRNASGTVLATLATYSNLDKGSSYVSRSFDLSAYKGQTVQLYFVGVEGSTGATSFLIDDASLK